MTREIKIDSGPYFFFFYNKWIIKNSTGSQKAETKVNNDKDCIKILLPVLCQFSHNSLNSLFQTLKEAGKLLEVHLIFWGGHAAGHGAVG